MTVDADALDGVYQNVLKAGNNGCLATDSDGRAASGVLSLLTLEAEHLGYFALRAGGSLSALESSLGQDGTGDGRSAGLDEATSKERLQEEKAMNARVKGSAHIG